MNRARNVSSAVLLGLLVSTSPVVKGRQNPVKWRIAGAVVGAPVRYNTSSTHFVYGDTWSATWSVDAQGKDVLYSTTDDANGFNNELTQPNCKPNCGRNLAFVSFGDTAPPHLTGKVVNDMKMFGAVAQPAEGGPPQEAWKANGLIAIDGNLYMTVSRHIYGQNFLDLRQRAKDATILVSRNHGQTWEPQPSMIAEPLSKVMFPGPRFATPFFIEYGKDGAIPANADPVDQAGEFVYAISTDGFWDNGNQLILGRARRSAILDAQKWAFFSGMDPHGKPKWEQGPEALSKSRPVLSCPGKCSMAGIQFIPALGLYVLPEWHYPELNASCDPNTKRPLVWEKSSLSDPNNTCIRHSRWEFYSAPHPWGPWTSFFKQDFAASPGSVEGGYYNPYIPSKFIAPEVAADGAVSMWVFATGDFASGNLDWSKTAYTLYMFPLKIQAKPEK